MRMVSDSKVGASTVLQYGCFSHSIPERNPVFLINAIQTRSLNAHGFAFQICVLQSGIFSHATGKDLGTKARMHSEVSATRKPADPSAAVANLISHSRDLHFRSQCKRANCCEVGHDENWIHLPLSLNAL